MKKIDEAVLEELACGPGTVKEIGERLAAKVQVALYRLVEAEKIPKPEGYLGKGNPKTYRVHSIRRI